MRIGIWDRILSALVGLIIIFIGICVFVVGLGVFPFKIELAVLEGPFLWWQRTIMVAVALVLFLLGFHSLLLLFRSQRKKGFIVQHTEHGDVSISLHAMENMVRKCIDTHEELKVSQTRIYRTRDGVVVSIRVSLANGVNIPLTVNALQKQIKHYITSCSGVDVKEVRVMVETGNHQRPKSAEVIAPDLVAADASIAAQESEQAEPPKEAIHHRIFKHEEAPMDMPAPPMVEGNPPMEAEAQEEPAIDVSGEVAAGPSDKEAPSSEEDQNSSEKENE